jgi:ankyrin repeat protein
LHYLLEKGADVNIGANNVIPHALLLVTDQSLTELVALLLKHGANVNT